MNFVKILKSISEKNKPFVIAEAGINHDGSLKKAIKMIAVAKAARANAIKFQTYNTDELISNKKQLFYYKIKGKSVSEPMYNIFKRCEFSKESWIKIKKRCDKEKIIFLSTPSSFTDINFLLKLKVPAIKIGSDDFTNIPLIQKAKRSKLPLILSCGMSSLKEIEISLKNAGAHQGYPIILMLCVSKYPTPPEDVHISRLKYLKSKYPKLKLGFSDHTEGSAAAILATGYGAKFFEKHFTLNKNHKGPDHWFSEDPKGLKKWIHEIKISLKMLGNSKQFPVKSENKMKALARKSLVASKDIKKGEKLSENNIGFKRPGNGLTPDKFSKICGMKSKIFIKKNTKIRLNLLSN